MRVVFTGGPGSGKTTTLRRLQAMGYTTVEESARALIADRKSRGLPPRPEPVNFARALVDSDVEKYTESPDTAESVFFDRGLLDSLLMLEASGALDELEKRGMLARYPYHNSVFFFPPWRAIYTTDAERDQDFDESVRVARELREGYLACGYTPVDVPCSDVDSRCQFILQHLATAPDPGA